MAVYCLAALAVVIGLDQLTKYLSVAYLTGTNTFSVIQGILHFTYVENRGAAFGMLSSHRWIFISISIAALLGIALFLIFARPKSMIVNTSLVFILGGGIGNMIDRIFRGFVVDFIDVRCVNFYVFNVADSFVCIGCATLIVYLIVDEIKNFKKTKKAA